MKCYDCGEQLHAKGAGYVFNYQDGGTKFYGLMWCQKCGKKILELLKGKRPLPLPGE